MAKRWTDAELRESISRVGMLYPVVRFEGETLEGRRREAIARDLCADVPTIECVDRVHAARVMWQRDPERAWKLFGEPRMKLSHASWLFGVPPSQIPNGRERKDRRTAKTRGKLPENVKLLVCKVPAGELKAYHRRARERGTTVSALVRAALAEKLPDVPTYEFCAID